MKRTAFAVMAVMMICFGCSKQKSDSDLIEVESSQVTKSNTLKGWSCLSIATEDLCMPDTWKRIEVLRVFFYADLGDSSQNTYFGISKHDATNLTAATYLRGLYEAIQKDTVEKVDEYELTELVFEDKVAYYIEFISRNEQHEYANFMMLWQDGKVLLDFGLKAPKEEKEFYYKTFQSILYSYENSGKFGFSIDDKLKGIKHLKFEDL